MLFTKSKLLLHVSPQVSFFVLFATLPFCGGFSAFCLACLMALFARTESNLFHCCLSSVLLLWSSVVAVQMLLILNMDVTSLPLFLVCRGQCLAGGWCDICLSFNVWRSGECIISRDNQHKSLPKSICVPIDLQVTVFRLGRNSNKLLSPFENPHSQTFC